MYWFFVFLFLYALFPSVCNPDGLSAKIVFFLHCGSLALQKILKQFFSPIHIFSNLSVSSSQILGLIELPGWKMIWLVMIYLEAFNALS